MKEQIEEIQNTLITISKHPIMIKGLEHWSDVIAEELYNAGYRKQKEGEWIKIMNHRECSECHYRAPYKKIKAGYHLQDLTRLCPNCGSHMKGESNDRK